MYCSKCGAELPDQAQFCHLCGTRGSEPVPVAPIAPPAAPFEAPPVAPFEVPPAGSYIPPVEADSWLSALRETEPPAAMPVQEQWQSADVPSVYAPIAPPPKKKLNKMWIILPAAGVFVAVCLVVTLLMIQAGKVKRYDSASVLMDDGSYSEAYDLFTALGEFEDSAAMAEECQDAMNYEEASGLMAGENYAEAKVIFDKLVGYRDAGSLSVECQNAMDYHAAYALMDAGDHAGAKAGFENLSSYRDASALAKTCGQVLDYAEAKVLMDDKNYEGAIALFTPLAADDYADAEDLLENCENIMTYAEAEAALANGENYAAYKLFNSLNNYEDAPGRASKCIVSQGKGELYRNSAFAKKIALEFRPPDDGFATYIKVYSGETLVSASFMKSGERYTIKLPKGNYTIKAAYGKTWFGEKDMFGDDGTYYKMNFYEDGAGGAIVLKSGYKYWITMRMSGGGGNASSTNENRDSF